MKKKLIIGTRGSKLALWQANWVKAQLEAMDPSIQVELNTIKTTGDKILDVALAKVGGKGLFVKEIEEALLEGKADLAVHSMKDVPVELPPELHLKAICKREAPADALVCREAKGFASLPSGAHVGTSSLRRTSQLLQLRPDLKISSLRGNLDTRLRKLDEGVYDAIVLAYAGMKRLGYEDRITEKLPPEVMLPAIGQGAVGIECRVDDKFVNELVGRLDHEETSIAVRAERSFLRRLEGGCQVPIAAYARLVDGKLVMDGLVGSPSGEKTVKAHSEGAFKLPEARAMGTALAERLIAMGAGEILAEVYGREIPPIENDIAT